MGQVGALLGPPLQVPGGRAGASSPARAPSLGPRRPIRHCHAESRILGCEPRFRSFPHSSPPISGAHMGCRHGVLRQPALSEAHVARCEERREKQSCERGKINHGAKHPDYRRTSPSQTSCSRRRLRGHRGPGRCSGLLASPSGEPGSWAPRSWFDKLSNHRTKASPGFAALRQGPQHEHLPGTSRGAAGGPPKRPDVPAWCGVTRREQERGVQGRAALPLRGALAAHHPPLPRGFGAESPRCPFTGTEAKHRGKRGAAPPVPALGSPRGPGQGPATVPPPAAPCLAADSRRAGWAHLFCKYFLK